jgi:hypothetical protein
MIVVAEPRYRGLWQRGNDQRCRPRPASGHRVDGAVAVHGASHGDTVDLPPSGLYAVAAAGHHSEEYDARTDRRPGAAHRHAIGTSVQLPRPLLGRATAAVRMVGSPYGWPHAGTLAVVLKLRAAHLKAEGRRFDPATEHHHRHAWELLTCDDASRLCG